MTQKRFTCPNCGEHRLEEVMTDVTVTSRITNIGLGGDLDYGTQDNDDGEVERYQCANPDCDFVVQREDEAHPVSDCSDLWGWLLEEEARQREASGCMTVRELVQLLLDSKNLNAVVGLCVDEYPHAPIVEVVDESQLPDQDGVIGTVLVRIGRSDISRVLAATPEEAIEPSAYAPSEGVDPDAQQR